MPYTKPGTLTAKQARFCKLYALRGNATQAAKEAGFRGKAVAQTAHHLLKKDHIKAEILREREQIVERADLTNEFILRGLMHNSLTAETAQTRVTALNILAEINGLKVKRTETGSPGEFSKLTDKEINAEMKKIERQLKAVA